jgi:DNA-binding CsgD family transcriptional regulator
MREQRAGGQGLLGLPQFMQFMSNRPDAQSVVDALLHGPFLHLDASACHIYRYEEPNQLVLYGGRGLEESLMARCSMGHLDVSTPLTDAFLNLDVELLALSKMLEVYPYIRMIDEVLWQPFIEGAGDQMLLCAPIVMNGVAVGAYSVFLPEDYRLTGSDCALFAGIGALLGLWMTHMLQIRVLERMHFDFEEAQPAQLTDRQCAILALVEEGRSIGSITRMLGYSQSTIRQELQRVMKALRVTNRMEAATKARQLGVLPTAELKRA